MEMTDAGKEGPLFRLDQVEPGRKVRVVHVLGRGKARRRLLPVGMVPGALVKVLRKAPLEDPVEYRVKGSDFSIRGTDAHLVEVIPVED